MARNSQRKNNNPEGRNQYSSWGVMEMAKERPMAAAVVAAGTAAAGLFLWSKRTQISDQMSQLSDQLNEWRSSNASDFDDTAGLTSSRTMGMSETGGGNASLGRKSGGAGPTGSASGRGRARSTATS